MHSHVSNLLPGFVLFLGRERERQGEVGWGREREEER